MSKMLSVKTPDQMVAEEADVIPKIIDLLSELSSAQQKRVVDYVASVVEQWRGPWSKTPNPEAPTVAPPAMPRETASYVSEVPWEELSDTPEIEVDGKPHK